MGNERLTAANYQQFVERMISRYEGGYGWNRNDPGGPTKYGITCYDLAQHRHQHMTSMSAWASIVRAMTLTEADTIYAEKYATACAFNDLRTGCDCVVLDFGVNSGPLRSAKYSQHIVGVAQDGIIGPVTVRAINAYISADFINRLCDARMQFLRQLGIWGTFGKGWTSRIRDLRAYALGLLEPHPRLMARQYQHKTTRITLAFAKGWRVGDEDSSTIV